jgi:hypothetical protein
VKKKTIYFRNYYEEKDRWQMQMEAQKARINEIERTLNDSKRIYSEAMNALRLISDEVNVTFKKKTAFSHNFFYYFKIHLSRRTRKIHLKQREPCIGAEKPDQFYDNLINTSKSLENLQQNTDSTDETNSEECASLDTISINSKKTALEKRSQFAAFTTQQQQQQQQQKLEYFSFAPTSEPSSRSSSPVNKDGLKLTSQSESRIIVGESNESLNKEIMNLNYEKSYSADGYEMATEIINSNPKINKSSSFYFSNSIDHNSLKNRLPIVPGIKAPITNNKTKVKHQETPLLTNLLLYNSAISKITNNSNTRDNQRTNKL